MIAIRRIAIAAAILTYGLIVLGALVRATNSGLSCPDWPTCYGQWVLTPAQFAALPETGYTYLQIMLEWTHRLIAGAFLGPIVLVLLGVIVWRRRQRPELLWAAIVLVGLLIFQKLLGGVTVLDKNSPWSVALHLGNALLVLTAIVGIAVQASAEARTRAPTAVLRLAGFAWVFAILAMVTAAMTAKSGASMACSTWPLCNDQVIPDLSDELLRIHFLHRSFAALFALTLAALAVRASRADTAADLRILAYVALALVAAQVTLGALIIFWGIPVAPAVTHQALGVLTFTIVTVLLWMGRGRVAAAPTNSTEGAPDGLALRRA